MRRVGKSYLLRLLIEHLGEQNIAAPQIVSINKESLDFDFIRTYKELDDYIKEAFKGVKGRRYLFIDEIQEIEAWEKTICSLFTEGDTDIFIAGSNANLLSSELATLLSGRYIAFPVYSLSLKEFLLFNRKEPREAADSFRDYLKFGGLPALHHFEHDPELVYQYIASIYNTILLKDVVKRNNIRNVFLLENLTKYAFDNIGNLFSAKKVADYLKSQRIKVGVETVQNYLAALVSTYALHKAPRYDIRGKRILELHEKYYLADIGLRHALLGYREGDISAILENIVYLELLRRGCKVFIGKIGDKEVDFIAEHRKGIIYIQVAYLLSSPETVAREFSALEQIRDNYPKYILSMDTIFGNDIRGIRRINLVDFLMGDVEDLF